MCIYIRLFIFVSFVVPYVILSFNNITFLPMKYRINLALFNCLFSFIMIKNKFVVILHFIRRLIRNFYSLNLFFEINIIYFWEY